MRQRLQFPDADVPIPGFGGTVGLDLQRNDATHRDTWVGFRVIDRGSAIDPQLNATALAANAVIVPGIGANRGRRGGRREHAVAARFVEERAPVPIAQIGLESDGDSLGLGALRTSVDPAVGTLTKCLSSNRVTSGSALRHIAMRSSFFSFSCRATRM
jgi:hypothetical protein